MFLKTEYTVIQTWCGVLIVGSAVPILQINRLDWHPNCLHQANDYPNSSLGIPSLSIILNFGEPI